MIAFHKWSDDGSSRVIVVINLDPKNRQETNIHLPLEQLSINYDTDFAVEDVIYEEVYTWRDSTNFVALDPRTKPVHVLKVRKS